MAFKGSISFAHDSKPQSGTMSPSDLPSGLSSAGTVTPSKDSHSTHHYHARRLLYFIRPSGRHVHIAHTPEEDLKLRRELSAKYKDEEFEIFILGTPEHIDAVRELHAHHEAERNMLREQHGQIYDQFEKVKNDLDSINEELHHITEHGVSLDANFSKFGYSAHLRTKDDSSITSPSEDGDDHSSMEKHKDRSTESIKFWKRPVIRQYFHKGLLWRSSKSGEVASFELFADLLYVGVIGILGDKAAEDPTGKAFLEFVITFIIGWKIWSDLTMTINWFEIDDIFQRICALFYLVLLFGYTTNIQYAFEDTYTPMIAFFMTARLYQACYFLLVAYLVPTVRGTMVLHAIIMCIASFLWIASIHVDYPARLGLIWVAIFIDTFGGMGPLWFIRSCKKPSSRYARLGKKYFDFYPAVNIEHRTERNNAFVTLVFGYSVLTILFQNRAHIGFNAFLGKGILGLCQAFCFNWIYFEIDHYKIHVHAIRRHWASSMAWIAAHLPFVMAYVLAAATLSKLVLAHDCADANVEDLGETYAEKSAAIGGELPQGLRWFYCSGIGLSLIFMALISFCHIHKKIPNARLLKRPRLAVRVCIGIVIICLPLAHSLNSLDLISITTALVFFVLVLDLYGNSCAGEKFWTGGFCHEERRKCQYTARCKLGRRKRQELIKALQNGEKVRLEDLRRKDSMSSISSERTITDEEWHGGHY